MDTKIIEFSIKNYKIFKEKATLTMAGRKNKKHTFDIGGEDLLKTSLIYGPNASGKSTVIEGIDSLINLIQNSVSFNNKRRYLPYLPHKFDNETVSKPVEFELIFSLEGTIFEYYVSFISDTIMTEELKSHDGGKKNGFERHIDKVTCSGVFSGNEHFIENTKKNTLYLSLMSSLNHSLSKKIVESLSSTFNTLNSHREFEYERFTTHLVDKGSKYKKLVLDYLKKADFGISDIKIEEVKSIVPRHTDNGVTHNESTTKKVKFGHKVQGGKKGEKVYIGLNNESVGTGMFYKLIGPILNTLEEGKVLFIDEFDNSLHPRLTHFIIDLFQDKKTNPKNAQLIVTTHDTSLLNLNLIKEHFWFTDKDENGGGKLFSLAEFNTIRNDSKFGEKYLDGRFGANPFIRY